ncbi:MAG: hypothetical protein UR93_C0019G0014 [Berkelbacteria bacterium GW2011_GWA2_35_9]|uniref:Polymerase beta nucleotidyltransferase domain-containing protein n=1 Tax=Berkelbacteria bacterium GW2011_GWA2_35_9 TaxID=1618333 RepID=A0A0G0D1V3_9BACT|nr:MAG: hypothetical protein UR93_C0019G0014 [Berkelbacteria bacterium GW2011_GWA2_35_9]
MEKRKYNSPEFKHLSQQYGLNFLVLFGSHASGLANQLSDFDIGYSADNDIDIETEHQITTKLKNILNNPKVDLVNVRKTTPLLAKKALLEGALLAENTPHSFANDQIRAYHNYVETKPLRELK